MICSKIKNLKADALITGHYVKSLTKIILQKCIELMRIRSKLLLFNTTREQLNYLRFP